MTTSSGSNGATVWKYVAGIAAAVCGALILTIVAIGTQIASKDEVTKLQEQVAGLQVQVARLEERIVDRIETTTS